MVDFEILKNLYRSHSVIIVLPVDFSRLFRGKVYYKACCGGAQKRDAIFFLCRSLLLSTTVLNDLIAWVADIFAVISMEFLSIVAIELYSMYIESRNDANDPA